LFLSPFILFLFFFAWKIKLGVNLLESSQPKDHKHVMVKRLLVRFPNRPDSVPLPLKEVVDDLQEFQRQGYLVGDDFHPVSTQSPFDVVFGKALREADDSLPPPADPGSNIIFQMIRKRHPMFFTLEDAKRDVHIASRIFMIESFEFVKSVVLAFQPHLRETGEAWSAQQLGVRENVFPADLCKALLAYIDILESGATLVPNVLAQHRMMKGHELRPIIYRSTCQQDLALASARASLAILRTHAPIFLFRSTFALFVCGACFLQYLAFDEVDEVILLLRKCSSLSRLISESIDVLTSARNAALFQLSQVQPGMKLPVSTLDSPATPLPNHLTLQRDRDLDQMTNSPRPFTPLDSQLDFLEYFATDGDLF